MVVDVKSKSAYPIGALSNFAPHEFYIDGIKCASMEGFLQSLKFEDVCIQEEICGLIGGEAKRRGQERNDEWKKVQKLWWRGREYDRHGGEYQDLLNRAFKSLSLNEDFRNALLATGENVLTHSIGDPNPENTILTEDEFCSRLMKLRVEFSKNLK